MTAALELLLAVVLVALEVACAIAWLAGIVLASGFWSTVAAIFIPLWAWYLVVERGMQVLGIL